MNPAKPPTRDDWKTWVGKRWWLYPTAIVWGLWWVLGQLNYRLPRLPLFLLLEQIAVVGAVSLWVYECDDRIKERHYRAWELINAARGSTGDGGRRDALQDLNKDGVSLAEAPLEKAYLPGVDLEGARFLKANLTGANLESANFRSADLRDANLQGAFLFDAHLQNAILGGFIESSIPGHQVSFFSGANLQGANLTSAKLRNANLQGANLQGADLSVAQLQYAKLGTSEALRSRFENRRHDILSQTIAKIESAGLQIPDQLKKQRDALDVARWQNTIKNSALWTTAKSIDLNGANLQHADLSCVELQDANLQDADLEGADLEGADLTGADLGGANLTGADLEGSNLTGANLREANLQGANLGGCMSPTCARSGADIERINLGLPGASTLTQEQIDAANGDDRTVLPVGLTRPADWSTPGLKPNLWAKGCRRTHSTVKKRATDQTTGDQSEVIETTLSIRCGDQDPGQGAADPLEERHR